MNVLDMYLPFNKSIGKLKNSIGINILLVWYNLTYVLWKVFLSPKTYIVCTSMLFKFVYLIILCLVNPIPILNLLGLRYLHSLEGCFLLSIFGLNYRQT